MGVVPVQGPDHRPGAAHRLRLGGSLALGVVAEAMIATHILQQCVQHGCILFIGALAFNFETGFTTVSLCDDDCSLRIKLPVAFGQAVHLEADLAGNT